MSVGVVDLDDDHKAFFACLGQIVDALNNETFEEAERICHSLIATGVQHAAKEEAFLRRNRYPGLGEIIKVQKLLADRSQRLLTLLHERSPEARDFADKLATDLVDYLLRGDINFKSFVQEMRDLGRLK